jgi:hypothetical protein
MAGSSEGLGQGMDLSIAFADSASFFFYSKSMILGVLRARRR